MNKDICPKCDNQVVFFEWTNAWTKKVGCNNSLIDNETGKSIPCEYSFLIEEPGFKKKFESFKPKEFPQELYQTKVKRTGCCFCNYNKEIYFRENIWFYGRKLAICKECYDFIKGCIDDS